MMPPFSGETEALFFDYGIDLVQIIDSEHYIFHNEAVRTVFEGAGALLRGDLDFISKNYDRPIPAEEAILIALISGSDVLQEQTKREERVNMCTAMARLEEECLINSGGASTSTARLITGTEDRRSSNISMEQLQRIKETMKLKSCNK